MKTMRVTGLSHALEAMNKIIHKKCVILTSGIFMKVHENSPL